MGDEGHRGGKVIGNIVVLVLVPLRGVEDVAKLAHLGTEIGRAEV